jgi:hypothetical protein
MRNVVSVPPRAYEYAKLIQLARRCARMIPDADKQRR